MDEYIIPHCCILATFFGTLNNRPLQKHSKFIFFQKNMELENYRAYIMMW